MKKLKWFSILSLSTTLFWYLVTSFIYWDITWVRMLPNLDEADRFLALIFFFFKILIDFGLWIGPISDELKLHKEI